MTRYTISGIEHMVRMLATQPALMSLNSLAPLQHIANKAQIAGKKCGCNASNVYREHKADFELALNNLANGDHLVMKRILKVDQICYYTKIQTGALKLKCI